MSTWLEIFSIEIQAEILKRLDITSLLRLMCTCKSIYNIVSNPALLTDDFVRGARTDIHIYSYRSSDGRLKFFTYRDTKNRYQYLKEISSVAVDIMYFFIGSVHGLVCFAKTFHPTKSDIILWNPFLGKSVTIPVPVAGHEKSCVIGFGFDRHCLDYKVVRVGIVDGYSTCWADVYLVRQGCWNKVVGSISRPGSRIIGDGVFVNNAIHWILRLSNSSTHGQNCQEYSILAYDLSKEVFREMHIDETMGHMFMSLTKLFIKGDEKLVLYRDDHRCNDFCIWVMEEYGVVDSWRKICKQRSKSRDYFTKVLHSRKNEEIVLSTTGGGLFLFKIKGDKVYIKVIKDEGFHLDYVGPLVRSLVFVEQPCVEFLLDTKINKSDISDMEVD
ncbi:hypothetical protein vseg_019020 [Gypsophila vaccaria]